MNGEKVEQKEQLKQFELLLIGVRVHKSASQNTSHSDVPDSYGLPLLPPLTDNPSPSNQTTQ